MFNKNLLLCVFFAFAFCILGCTQPQKKEQGQLSLEEMGCPSGFIRGTGIGTNEQEAMAQARSDISSQIRLSITVAKEQTEKQFLTENKEITEMEFNSQIKQTTELLNAQDAKMQAIIRVGNQIGIVACMSRGDAAKPYLSQLPQINDSLNLAVQTVLSQNHPLAKKEAVRAAENLRMRQIMTAQILQGLGKYVELPENELYEKMIGNFRDFSSGFKIIWVAGDEQISQILASRISSRYKIETGSCVHGIKLIPVSLDVQCENNKLYGPRCSFLPVMEGRSCTDELYFTMRGQMVYGTGLNGYDDAMRKLHAVIPNAPFWQKWFEELDKYCQ